MTKKEYKIQKALGLDPVPDPLYDFAWQNSSRWFDFEWYRYLFSNTFSLKHFICKIKKHPSKNLISNNALLFKQRQADGWIMRCKNCGENLG